LLRGFSKNEISFTILRLVKHQPWQSVAPFTNGIPTALFESHYQVLLCGFNNLVTVKKFK